MALIAKAWTRRDFLRAAGIGASAAALFPFIPTASAQTGAAAIKRLVLLSHPNGTIIHRWRSNGAGAPFVSGAALPALKGPVLAPLERHRSAVALVDGLDIASGALPRPGQTQGHNPGHWGIASLWTGSRLTTSTAGQTTSDPAWQSMAASIDQLLAAQAPTRVRSLVVGTSNRGRSSYYPTEGINAYAGPSQPIAAEDDPRVVFDLLFATGVDGSSAATARRRASRRSILTNVKGELSRLKAELPAIDRQRLERHLEGVDDLDRRIGAEAGAPVCLAPGRPASTLDTEVLNRLRLQVDIVKHAFACDLTRIANILVGAEGTAAPWVPAAELPGGVPIWDEHGPSHQTMVAPTEAARRVAVEIVSLHQRAMAEEFARLLDALDSGALLDDTLAVWAPAMGWGGPHLHYSVPFVVASKHPRLRAGRYHRFGNYEADIETSIPAVVWPAPSIITPHNRMLTTVMHLMGRTDVQAVGDPGVNGQQGGRDLDNSPISELIS